MRILPEEIIFNILIWVPAHVLYNVMRYVCRQWHRIISDPQFVNTHLRLSPTTLLMHSPPERNLCHLLDLSCPAKLTGLQFPLNSTYKVMSTCNGLMLIVTKTPVLARSANYVVNPITRRTLTLPPLPTSIIPFSCSLTFEASSKVYKVVVPYSTYYSSDTALNYGCAILTVGIDEAWRVLNCEHLSNEDMRLLMGRPLPVANTRFLYFVPISTPYMLALDLKSESINRISLPFSYRGERWFLPVDNSISAWYPRSDYSMEVWVLKDYISQEWVKKLYIHGKPIRNELDKVIPLDELHRGVKWGVYPRSWLGNGERILFRAVLDTSRMLVYDLKTHGCCQLAWENGQSFSSEREALPFVNSLAWVY